MSGEIFISRWGWVDVLTEPQESPCIWPYWDSEDVAVLKAVYSRYGRHVAAYTLGKKVWQVTIKINSMGLKRFPRPCADKRGGV